MFNPNKKQNNVLEEFRIKAHMRSYIKDPIVIDTVLMRDAVEKLKKLPFETKDPTDKVAVELLMEAYRRGYFKKDDLTRDGYKVIKLCKHRRHHQFSSHSYMPFVLRHHH